MTTASQPEKKFAVRGKQIIRRALASVTALFRRAMQTETDLTGPKNDGEHTTDQRSLQYNEEIALQAVPHDFKVLIHEGELNHIAGWVMQDEHRETGGDLCGFWTNTRSPSVQFVLGPGPRARHQLAAFYQDTEYLRLAQEIGRKAHGLQHIGEWHSHHRLGLAEPSGGDAATIANVFLQYPIDEFLLCIATIGRPNHTGDLETGRNDVRVGAYLFRRGIPGFQRGGWVVLPGLSPVAERVREQGGLRGADRPLQTWEVRRVSLEQPAGRAEAPPRGWYTQADGLRLLREFDGLCQAKFNDCQMSVDKGVMTYAVGSEGIAWEICFPVDFPNELATLSGRHDALSHKLSSSAKDQSNWAHAMFAEICRVISPESVPPVKVGSHTAAMSSHIAPETALAPSPRSP